MEQDHPPSIPGYRIIGRLGQGGMATVWRAEQTALGREVALKVVVKHLVADPRSRERFLREARASARVVHPNVITCHDAGEAGGQLFIALELVTGGDLRQLIDREGGRLDPWRSVHLIRDCLNGLAAVEAAKLVHRDIKPGNIFLTAGGSPKLADLGLARTSAGGAELTMPGMVVGTPAYIAPEQARAVPDLDIRADIYALGATLFHCISGHPPYPGDDPMGVLVQVLNDPVPDLAQVVKGCPAEVAWLARSFLAKDRNERPSTVAAALEQAARVLDGRHGQPGSGKQASRTPAKGSDRQAAQRPSDRQPAQRPVTTDVHKPSAAPTPAATSAPAVVPRPIAIDKNQLAVLAKRIIVDQGGLRASLALAPGASFPKVLLDQILLAAGVVHGLNQASLHAATTPKDVPRRLILAKGTPPSPGIAGRDVHGDSLSPLALSVSIQVAEDCLQAVAYTRPGQVARREDLELGVKQAGLRYGLDPEALRRLVDGPPSPGGRVIVARGRAADPGRRAGFQLAGAVANTTVEQIAGSEGNLRRVMAGETVAWWDDGLPQRPGMDVLGREIAAPPLEPATPESCCGTGTELSRDEDGRLALRSRVSGFVQRQPDGCVRVVGIFAIEGDLGPESPPVVTEDVVVVRGSVKSGASITTASDVVIMGDLEDAVINAGGHVEVDGAIGAGAPIAAAGTVLGHGGGSGRTIMAGAVRIEGEVRDCEVRATGDVSIKRIIGGAVTAGGNLRVEVAGDSDGTTTMLWAGRHLTYAEEAKLAQLAAARADSERSRIMRERQALESEVVRAQASRERMRGAMFVNQEEARRMEEHLRQLETEAQRVKKIDETARRTLAESRQQAGKMVEKGINGQARIEVGSVAHAGVVVRLADAEAEALREPRLRMKLGS